jgi:hypothetical protein
VLHVVRVQEPRVRAARETAALVPGRERPPHRRRHRAALPADGERIPLPVLHDRDDPRIAREAPRRFRGNAHAVLELATAFRGRIHQDRGIHVHDDLVRVRRATAWQTGCQRAVGEEHERIRATLREGRARLRDRRVVEPAVAFPRKRSPVHRRFRFRRRIGHRVHRGVQCLEESSTELRRQPPLDHQVPMLVVSHVQVAPLVVLVRLPPLAVSLHLPVGADHALHLRSRPVGRDLEQELLVPRVRDPGDRPHLAVAQGPLLEPGRDLRKPRQRVRDPHLLPRGLEPDAGPPGEELGAALEADPLVVRVELS